jgi:hypothetical protein
MINNFKGDCAAESSVNCGRCKMDNEAEPGERTPAFNPGSKSGGGI